MTADGPGSVPAIRDLDDLDVQEWTHFVHEWREAVAGMDDETSDTLEGSDGADS